MEVFREHRPQLPHEQFSDQKTENLKGQEFPKASEVFARELPETAYGRPFPLEPEIRFDVPNCTVAFVTGWPHHPLKSLDYRQGDNPYLARGNCGLMSIMNSMRAAGKDIDENTITKLAIDNKLCEYHLLKNPKDNGGTTGLMRQKVLEKLGIDSEICTPGNRGSLDDIADAIECGKGVIISGNAGVLWNKDDGIPLVNGKPKSNHCVAVTGVARDASTGNVAGVYICDSGRGLPSDACRYLTKKEFNAFYTDVYGSCANITKQPLKPLKEGRL